MHTDMEYIWDRIWPTKKIVCLTPEYFNHTFVLNLGFKNYFTTV